MLYQAHFTAVLVIRHLPNLNTNEFLNVDIMKNTELDNLYFINLFAYLFIFLRESMIPSSVFS